MNNNAAPSIKNPNPVNKDRDISEILKDAGYKYENDVWKKGLKSAIINHSYNSVDTFHAGVHTGTKRGVEQIKAAFPKDKDKLQTRPFKLSEAAAAAKLDFVNSKPLEPYSLIEIGGEMVLSAGNILTVIGKAKAGKSSGLTLLIAQVLKSCAPNQKVYWIDTEQSMYHVYKIVERITTITGIAKDALNKFFEVYALRPYSVPERQQIVQKLSENFKENDLVIVDGARDLLADINNPGDANEVLNLFMKITDEKKVGLVTVLHQNKNDQNARGHLGSELTNKSETVIEILPSSQNEEIVLIEPNQCRNKPFSKVAFRWDDNGTPVFVDPPVVTKNGKITPSAMPVDWHRGIVARIFSLQAEIRKTELSVKIQNELDGFGMSIGIHKAANFIEYYEKNNLVAYRMDGRKSKVYFMKGP
jgi:archaellum biogenesis ATPase FlaH